MENLQNMSSSRLPFLTLHLCYYDLPGGVICNIATYADDTTLYSNCDRTSDLWEQLQLAFELQSILRNTVSLCRKLLVDFNAGNIKLASFNQPNNTGAIDVKMDQSVLEEKSSFKMLALSFSPKLGWSSYPISVAKTASKKIRALIRSMQFLSPEAALYLYNGLACNVVISGLVLLAAS